MTEEEVARKQQVMVLEWVIKLTRSLRHNEANLKLDVKTTLYLLEARLTGQVSDIQAWDNPNGPRIPTTIKWE